MLHQEERTRSIKILLIVQDPFNNLKYFRIIDPSKQELERLAEANGKRLDANSPNYGAQEIAIGSVLRRCGIDYFFNANGLEEALDPVYNTWLDSKLHENQVKDFMGWDRVYITGIQDN
jgi:hypothetical protein